MIRLKSEPYAWLKMLGAATIGYITFLASHNVRQSVGQELLVPEQIMVHLQALAVALGTMGFYMTIPPTGGKVDIATAPEEPESNATP